MSVSLASRVIPFWRRVAIELDYIVVVAVTGSLFHNAYAYTHLPHGRSGGGRRLLYNLNNLVWYRGDQSIAFCVIQYMSKHTVTPTAQV